MSRRWICGVLLLMLSSVAYVQPAGAAEFDSAEPPSFVEQVVPLLTRLGCSAGGCHGKLAGQNGFRLSLRGYAPELDHLWIARESRGRRINLAAPELSLLLRKGLNELPHGGGQRLEAGSRAHQVLTDWIAAGAPGPLSEEATVERLEVHPSQQALEIGQTAQLEVQARYTDGSVRDVTWMTVFESNDPAVLDVSPAGLVTATRHGETAVTAGFQGLVEVALFSMARQEPVEAQWYAERDNFIDQHVFDKLAALRIEPSPRADDATFIRRAFLDTLGTLPTPEEVRHFLDDPRPGKRAHLVDQLLERPEFVDFWALQLGDLLQNRKERDHDVRGTKGVRQMHQWLRQQVAANRPWDQLARAVLSATGPTSDSPAVGYFVVNMGNHQADQSELPDAVAQAFLGTRIGCAKCHNHPLEKYTQDDYFHFAAFFSRVALQRQKPEEGPTTLHVATGHMLNLQKQLQQQQEKLQQLETSDDQQQREQVEQQIASLREQLEQARQSPAGVTQPRTRQVLSPRPLDRSEVDLPPGADPRSRLIDWMTDPGNEHFAGAMVNRLWKHFLGVGLVEPVDDLRATNPPSHPALWQSLIGQFVESGYDLKHMMRLILNSRTYQLSSATRPSNVHDTRYYSHYYARRLPAEVLLDAISHSTGVPERFPGYPLGVRAIQVPDPGVDSYFLSLFGRSERVTACACERQNEVTLPQLLHLHNGEAVTGKIRAADGRLTRLLDSQPDDGLVLEELFLATFSRPPTADEQATIRELLAQGADRREVFQDVFWALLNSKDFAFNH